jgi:HK97 gp10 family phage protein
VANIAIEGLDDVLAALKALPDSITKNAAPFAMRKGANVIAKEAKARAPVGKTRKLVTSIAVRKRKKKPREFALMYSVGVLGGASATYGNTRANRRKGLVGKKYDKGGNAFYWRYLELGTEKMPAKSFLRPALHAKADDAVKAIADGFRTGLTRAVTKALKA